MKLRTEMLRGPDGMTITAGYSEGKYSAREHDAACAHALMLAMEEFKAITGQIDDGESIEMRAGMIMREWGFDSGEVE